MRLASEVLAREGFVRAKEYPPELRYADRLAEATRAALEEGLGLWEVSRKGLHGKV